MIRRKIVLSILLMGFISLVAVSGTWALYNDIITSDNNHFSLAPWGYVTVESGNPSDRTLTPVIITNGIGHIDGYVASNVDPSKTELSTLKKIKFTDTGGRVNVAIHGETQIKSTMPAGLALWVDSIQVYSNNDWSDRTVTIGPGTPQNPYIYETDIQYQFDGVSNNNADAKGDHKFDLTFTITPAK